MAKVDKFKILDSGKRQEYASGMRRDVQESKARFDLIIPLDQKLEETLLYRWAVHMEKGIRKYGERNWEKANSIEELNRFKASAFRHFMQMLDGNEDEDHFAGVLFNLNCIVYLMDKIQVDIKGNENNNLMTPQIWAEMQQIGKLMDIPVLFSRNKKDTSTMYTSTKKNKKRKKK